MLNAASTEHISQQAQALASSLAPQRCLLVAERGAAWPEAADAWRAQGLEVSLLIEDGVEAEPVFVRRLYATVARAELEQRPFDTAALIVATDVGAHVEPARLRLSSALADVLRRAGRALVLHVSGDERAPAALRKNVERVERALARELRGSLLTLRRG